MLQMVCAKQPSAPSIVPGNATTKAEQPRCNAMVFAAAKKKRPNDAKATEDVFNGVGCESVVTCGVRMSMVLIVVAFVQVRHMQQAMNHVKPHVVG